MRFVLSFASLLFAAELDAQGAARPSLAEPSLSPDGREVVFTSGGDVWSAPADGGEARLLVADPALESRPLFSPDGRRVAFVSARTGNGDVYVLDLASGAVRRVTFDDAAETLDAWSRDGRWLYVSSSSRDIAGMNDVYRVSPEGGTPMPVAADRYASEYWAAPSPNGQALAITARGTVSGQWWRHGRSHLDESEIWLVSDLDAKAPTYTQVTTGGAKSAWAMWAPDARTLYFMSDRDGAENLWAQPMDGLRPNGAPRKLTAFRDGRVLWPSASADRRTIVFERDFGVWRYDVAGNAARAVPITLRGAPAGGATEHVAQSGGVQELALSPDGRKVAFTVRGEVFAAAARPDAQAGGPEAAFRVTNSAALEEELAWSPDSRQLVYASDRDGRWRLWLYDFATRQERALTAGAAGPLAGDVSPRWSPDGKEIAFTRGGRELRAVDVASGRERLVAAGAFERPPFTGAGDVRWSPDGRWLAFAQPAGAKGFTNVYVVESQGGTPRPVSFVANANTGEVAWGADGSYLLFLTSQRTEATQVARVDLVPRTPRFREDRFRDLFSNPAPPNRTRDTVSAERRVQSAERAVAADTLCAPRSALCADSSRRATRIVFEDIRRRLSLLPVGLDVNAIALSPDGKQLAITAAVAGQPNVYVYPVDDLATDAVARQLTTSGGFKADVQWAPDGKELFYRESGRIMAVNVDTRVARPVAATAEMDVDFAQEKGELFAEAWSYLRDQFYDETYHGADWNAVRERWAPQVAGAHTLPELRRLLNLMVGELNASHLGVNPGAGQSQPPNTGRLGLRFDRIASERDGVPRVAEVLPLGPAAIAGVRVGDAIASVDGRAVTRDTNLDDLLAFKIDRRVTLGLVGADGTRRDVALRPVNLNTEKGLLYRAWVESRRAYVDKASGGKLGYVHMLDMSAESLAQLYLDLDVENQSKQGVVVDVRNNNGGFVNAYALDVFGRRPYLTMQTRGFGPQPARANLGQRALELPTVLVTNQHSLSDAEDFTEGWRTLGLGPVVGEPTAGWIIFTWNQTLMDGTVLRLPRARITDHEGKDMELHPRPVDVLVVRPVGESYAGKDSQLDAAVAELMKKIR
ncbi:peptidase S41 [Gemmatirosa kalamazoonensis]|uniref:Tricorn protease homolog n=1 Tax=Gemmatirosa kalamazoonensis TaxID=861299 RepID=W0RE37_9BACT|nr:S41 family peptidase [Gemmatirosa kalamazoonensis]AHG89076.1 peptidase S41 [Gemmatirosa kalamazoonensis]